jgi:hypothetical protein
MPRLPLSTVALTLLLAGCAGSHKHAEVPDFTEKGWSDPAPELTSAKADRPIQPEGAKTEAATTPAAPVEASPTPAPAPAPAPADKPEASSDAEAAVIRGDALPPPPPGPAKTTKAHKSSKGTKRSKGSKSKKGTGTSANAPSN